MPWMTVPIALGIGSLALATGGATYGILSSNQARKESEAESKKQQASAAQLEKEFRDTQANLDKSTAGKDAKLRQQKLAAGAIGRRDTLLTGPSGIIGEPPVQRKTLLGL